MDTSATNPETVLTHSAALQQARTEFADVSFDGRPFLPYYEQTILPKVNEFERERLSALATMHKRRIPALLIGAAAIISGGWLLIAYPNTKVIPFFSIFLIMLAGWGANSWYRVPQKKYLASIKERIFPHVFRYFDNSFNYEPKGRLSLNALIPFGIIPNHCEVSTEDDVGGRYRDSELEIVEAKLLRNRSTSDNRKAVLVFKGILIIIKTATPLKDRIVVRQKGGFFNKNNWPLSLPPGIDKIELPHLAEQGDFEYYASNPDAARTQLTPEFMASLLELSQLFTSQAVRCSFAHSGLLIAFPTKKNFFEPADINQPATFTAATILVSWP